jgi:hypothetical protein
MLFAITFEQNRPAFLKGHVEHANAVHPSGGSGARRDGRLRRGSLAELRNELEAQPPEDLPVLRHPEPVKFPVPRN